VTANEDLFDGVIRHEIDVRRFSSGETRRLREFLEKLDAELVVKIRDRLTDLKARSIDPRSSRELRRLQTLLDDIRREREQIISRAQDQTSKSVTGFARVEEAFAQSALDDALPVNVSLISLSDAQVRSIVFDIPFQGHTLAGWFGRLAEADQRRVTEAINLGWVQGESVPKIVRRLIGTRSKQFNDGVLTLTRRQAEAVVRTAINHTANAVREEAWSSLGSAASLLQWHATLDGRTTPTCRTRDGQLTAFGGDLPASVPTGRRLSPPGARPPAHVNCRSVMVPVIDGLELIGDRPTVSDTRTRRKRERDFRADAKASVGEDRWRSMSETERRREISRIRRAWAEENIGRVPAKTD
jgi:hypothetical protein